MDKEEVFLALSEIWEVCKEVITWLVIIFWVVFLVVGGEFHVKIYFENVTEFFKAINSWIKN